MKHTLNIKAAADRSGKTYKDISKEMGMKDNAVSAAIKRDRERREWIRTHQNEEDDKKEISGGFRMEFLEKLASAIGCDLFELWETTDDEGNPVELYPEPKIEKEEKGDEEFDIEISHIRSHERTFDEMLQNPENAEMTEGIVTCPHCGQKIRPFQFFK